MRFRRRRRGRRKAAPAAASTSTTVQQLSSSKLYPIAALLIISINLFAIATLAQSVTLARPANSTDLTGTTRHQLYKRQSASANSQFSAESPQVTFPNNEQYHELDQQQQQQQQNHYEEPLALASSEDAPQDSQQTRQNKGKRTLYACEEKQLEIDCQVGESIQLIRANYGRFSIQICNEHGQLDWKVNCMSSDSYDIIARSCQAKQSCQLLASNEIFGDACPGTQKYLEVHYQCVSANRTQPSDQQQQQSQKGNQAPKPNRKQGNTVIQQQQHQQQPSFSGDSTTQASNSETPELQPKQQQPPLIITPPWMGPIITPPSSPKQLPDWMKEFGLNPAASSQSNGTPPPRTEPPNGEPSFSSSSPSSLAGSSTGSATGHCPEIVWRSIRWPETEAGQWAQRPCPAHTFPVASSTSAAAPVSQLLLGFPPTQAATAARLYCQPSGQWAERAHIPGRCHSAWLRNLTQRLDTGDSPLSILGELVARTQPTQVGAGGGGPSSHHERHHQQAAAWLSHATSSSLTSSTASQQPSSAGRLNRLPLFGEDLVQMGRIVGRLVDEMGELLTRISDDKQRITFAREMIQLITELISNLLNKDHSEAWLDLAPSASTGVTTVGPNNYPTSSGQSGERQRVAGQLLTGLESGCVLLAGALQHHHQQQHANGVQVPPKDTTASETSSINQDDFQKITDHVYVAIQSFELDLKQPGSSQRLQVTFPSQTSVLGTRWMDSDQRFTLNLQASNIVDMVGAEQQQQSQGQAYNNAGSSVTTSSSASGGQQQQLKIVGVMLRGLGAHLEPAMMSLHHQQQREATSSDKSSAPGDSSSSSTSSASLTVNSDLVGFSIVADSTRTPIKVDLSAPIELVFRHNSLAIVNGKPSQPPTMTPSSGSHCVYWDTSASDWSPAGCKLVASNRTHSVCACDHLATFGLLNELDQMLMMSGQQQEGQPAGTTTTSGPDGHHSGVRLTRVHLDNVESELAFDGRREMKAIYVARLLEGALFTGQTGARNFLYGSCCLSGLLLAILLAAAAYNRAHARRLLGSLPAEPPPSLLVANYHNNNSQRHNQHQRQQQQQQLQPSLTAGADRMLGAQSANGLHANAGPNGSIGTGTTTTTNGASPPNSSSSGGLAGPTAAASMDLLAAGSAKQEPANMLLGGHDDELNGFYTLIGNQSSQYGASMANIKHYHQLSSSQRHLAAKTNHLTTANGGSGGGQAGRHSISQLALVPVHLIVQLLLLQLLLLLLIESQNMLAWNSQQAKRTAFMQTSAQMMAAPVPFNEFSAAAAAASFQTGTGFPPTGFEPLASEQQQQLALDPIGNITWLAVFALYYLVSTLVYWLLARLIQLTGQLMELNELAPSASASAGNGKQYQPIQTLSGGAIYTQQQQQQPTINRYGPCQIHQNNNGPQQQQQASSSSPSLSNFSSLLAAELSPMIEQQQQQQLGGRLEHLESRQSDKEQTLYMRQSLARSARQLHQRANGNNNNNHDDDELGASCSLARCLARLATSRHLAGLLVHLGPPLTGCLLVWLTYDRAELINLAAYTTSWTSQLAYWPLALDAGWTFPLAFHLYCLPSICLALGILALAMLRRQFSQIYKTQTGAPSQPPFGATLTTTKQRPNHRHLESESALMADAKSHHNHSLNQHQQQLQLLQRRRVAQAGSGGHLAIELAAESKRAKFACLTLLALLALTSICWISFFIHCHQAVNNANHHHQQQQQQTSPSGGGHLILTFASSNLLISLLICCSQRKQLKRACQLLGLSRFVSLAGGHCCQLAEATKSSPASTSSVSSSSYYNNNNNSNNNPNTNSFHGAPDHHQHHHQQHYGTGKSIKISSSAAASQQSLFVISRSRPVLGSGAHGSGGGGGVTSLAAGGMLAEIAQATYGSAAGTGHQHNHQAQYSQQQQQQQHLHQNQYPMLANQHLYQQLAHAGSQQHIYDSTTNLSSSTELVEQQKQRQLNAFNLMAQQQQNHRQQQQQQFNQHEPMIHYTLGRPFNGGSGSQFHLNQQQQQQQGQQHYFQGPGNMTLKPMPSSIQQQQQMSFAAQQQQGARSNPHESLVCPINGAAKTHSASSSGRQQQQFQQQQQQQQLSASSSSSSGEADGPLVALAQTTTPTLLNNRRHELSNAMAANQSASPATFGPMHNYNSAMIMGSSSNNNNSQQATEHRLSSGSNHHNNNNNNDNQSFVEVIGHGAGNGANHCTAGPQAAAPSVKPIKHNNQNNNSSNNYNYNQIDQHLGKQTILGATSSQNYTDALKAAMVEEANQQHFRRTNSTAKRQQRQPAPPHRSFASTTVAGASSAAMIDAQLDYQSRPLGFGGSCSASGSHGEDTLRVEQEEEEQAKETQNDSNIYDVANCSPLVSR